MKSPFWRNTAIVIAYDDSDGWYDHQMSPIVNPSAFFDANDLPDSDRLNFSPDRPNPYCGHGTPLADANGNPIEGRCGYGPRLPLLIISPFAKENFVDHTLTDQSSICALSKKTGAPAKSAGDPSTNSPARSGICSTSVTKGRNS
jgi:phospholipase C